MKIICYLCQGHCVAASSLHCHMICLSTCSLGEMESIHHFALQRPTTAQCLFPPSISARVATIAYGLEENFPLRPLTVLQEEIYHHFGSWEDNLLLFFL